MPLNLPSLNDRQRERYATPKHEVQKTPLVKEEKRKSKVKRESAFRLAVWERDGGHSRASGKPLTRSGTAYDKVGEVHHVYPRSLAPELIYEPSNGILLSKAEHVLAETACPSDPKYMLLEIIGSDDRGAPQRFEWRNAAGKITKQRTG